MPQNVPLTPGATSNLGAGQVAGNLTVSAPFAGTFTITIGAAAPVNHVLGAAGLMVIPVNGAAVSITNTTAGVLHPPAGNLMLSW